MIGLVTNAPDASPVHIDIAKLTTWDFNGRTGAVILNLPNANGGPGGFEGVANRAGAGFTRHHTLISCIREKRSVKSSDGILAAW
jgi:hypothetical protein